MNQIENIGLQLAQEFYESQQETLKKAVPKIVSQWAVGLVGEGSECFGFDDQISRDHDWGPGFCIWLPKAIVKQESKALQIAMMRMPETFRGFMTRRIDPQGRVGVLATEDFYAKFINFTDTPENWQEWRTIPESFLAVATNGKVFEDNLGNFSRLRKNLLNYYPEDVRLKKIAARCMSMAQTGQYNMLRSLTRGETSTAMLCVARFIESAISCVYLLNKRYMPFYKWAHRGVQTLPVLGLSTHQQVRTLALLNWSKPNAGEQAEVIIEQLCEAIAQELRQSGLSDAPGNWLWEHGPSVQARIKIPQLRAVSVLLE